MNEKERMEWEDGMGGLRFAQMASSGRYMSQETIRRLMLAATPGSITGNVEQYLQETVEDMYKPITFIPYHVLPSKFSWAWRYQNLPPGDAWDGWLWYEVDDFVYEHPTSGPSMVLRAGCRLAGRFYEADMIVSRVPVIQGFMTEDELIETALPRMCAEWEAKYKDDILENSYRYSSPKPLDTLDPGW